MLRWKKALLEVLKEQKPVMTEKFAEEINAANVGWKADSRPMMYMTVEDAKMIMGLKILDEAPSTAASSAAQWRRAWLGA